MWGKVSVSGVGSLFMAIKIIDVEFVFFAFSALALVIGILSLILWFLMLAIKMKEIDDLFASPDFPLQGYAGIWPWGMGKCLSYGVFLIFRNSRYVKRKRPLACESIVIDDIPKKIKIIVSFPIYTVMPCAVIIWIGGVLLYVKDWLI